MELFVPVQLAPSPVYPVLHEHIKLPIVLVHAAFTSQLFKLELLHSLILSAKANGEVVFINQINEKITG